MKHPLIVKSSPQSVKETADRLVNLLDSKKIKVFARIDHSEAARASGLSLQEEQVVVFGDPKVGTGLMQECPPIGIELPLKIVVWQADQQTMVGYHDPKELINDYSVPEHEAVIRKMSELMAALVEAITKP
jgi:uncharacterized protein (DUF302 family)